MLTKWYVYVCEGECITSSESWLLLLPAISVAILGWIVVYIHLMPIIIGRLLLQLALTGTRIFKCIKLCLRR